MKVLFLHGWHSVVGGLKPTYLKGAGYVVINPALDDDDFAAALRTAQAEFDRHQPDVVVGSSRGGAVALNIDSGITPLVLLCPAWKNWGKVKRLKSNSVILHSRRDEVIPFADSQELIRDNGLSPDTLIEVGSDHRLADADSLSVMLWVCKLLVKGEHVASLPGNEQPWPATPGKKSSQEDVNYICDACGEEIVIPLDLSEGANQTYVEDCPVCCRANTIHVHIDEEGNAQVSAEPEQDYD